MVAPVSGPYSFSLNVKGPPNSLGYTPIWIKIDRTWYRQKRPYSLPLNYTFSLRRVVSSSDTKSVYQEYTGADGVDSITASYAYDLAYQRFVGKIKGESSALAVGLAEIQQSASMIEKRAMQLVRVAVAVKRLRFVEAAHLLGLSAKNDGVFRKEGVLHRRVVVSKRRGNFVKRSTLVLDTRKTAKSFANNWLEFSFGWLPTVSDIFNAVDIMQRPYPSVQISGQGMRKSASITRQPGGTPQNTWVINRDSECKVRISSLVTISNPNLFRANQLGLVNPLTVAYELVPFSFVLNWFVNVEEFLSQYTDFTGVNLLNPYRTAYNRCLKTESWIITNITAQPYGLVTYRSFTWENVSVTRSTGTPPGPSLKVRPPWRVSPKRALNAVSLLLQQLKPGR